MVNKKIATRDYLRAFVTKANKAAGVNFNSSKLNSKEECEGYILDLIKDLKNNSVAAKDNTELQDKIKRLESKQGFYETQAKEAGKQRAIWEDNYFYEKEKSFKLKLEAVKNKRKLAFSKFLLASSSVFVVLQFIIIMLLLRGAY